MLSNNSVSHTILEPASRKQSPESRKASASERVQDRNDELD